MCRSMGLLKFSNSNRKEWIFVDVLSTILIFNITDKKQNCGWIYMWLRSGDDQLNFLWVEEITGKCLWIFVFNRWTIYCMSKMMKLNYRTDYFVPSTDTRLPWLQTWPMSHRKLTILVPKDAIWITITPYRQNINYQKL